MHLLVLINPGSGTRSKKQFLKEIAHQCFDAGWSYEVRSSWYINKAQHIQSILKTPNVRIVICGGDGTISKVLKAFWQQKALSKVPFLIYPGGTFNALVKNTNYKPYSVHDLGQAISAKKTQEIDIWEMDIQQGKKKEREIFQTGALFIKDCEFATHAAQIRKSLHQFDFNLGFTSVRKSLPYLDDLKSFSVTIGKKEQQLQAFYLGNNPYLITENAIHSKIHINDGKLESFRLQDADFFQLGQAASVLLLGIKRDLRYLKVQHHRKLQFTLRERLHLNLDGDIRSLQKGTSISIKRSAQKAKLILYP